MRLTEERVGSPIQRLRLNGVMNIGFALGRPCAVESTNEKASKRRIMLGDASDIVWTAWPAQSLWCSEL